MTRKILHLITSLEGGGTENFLYQILAHSPAGYQHQVIYLKKDGVIGDRIRQKQIQVSHAESLRALYCRLKENPPHILHTCLYSAHVVGRLLGGLAGLSTIITSQRAIDIWQAPWQTVIDQWTLPLSTAVIVNSQAAADLIEGRRGKREKPEIFKIPNGIDSTRFQSGDRIAARERLRLPSDAWIGATLMRLHREKGADFIPLFASKVLPVMPKLHLLIGGVGPLEKSIKAQLAGFTFADRIHFMGWENDTPAFLSAANFFWSLSREESFPQTLVEASAMGLPWIAPDTGGVSELLQDGAAGRTYPRLDIPAAAAQAIELLNDLPYASNVARQASLRIQNIYSLQKMIDRVYHVFERF